jgi:hypothetical protein
VLGPSSATKAEEHPPAAVEGGEAGAGNLFGKGDVGVIPGAGVGGGSGARGSSGLGLGERAQAHGWEAFGRGQEVMVLVKATVRQAHRRVVIR